MSQICLMPGLQDFMFTLDYLPSRTSRSSESASYGSGRGRHLGWGVSNTSLERVGGESEDESSDEDRVQTWLKNELEDAKGWKPQPNLLIPPPGNSNTVYNPVAIFTQKSLPHAAGPYEKP